MKFDARKLKTDGTLTHVSSAGMPNAPADDNTLETPMEGFGMGYPETAFALPPIRAAADNGTGPAPYGIVDGDPASFQHFCQDAQTGQLRGIWKKLDPDLDPEEFPDRYKLLTPEWLREGVAQAVQAARRYVGNRYDSLLPRSARTVTARGRCAGVSVRAQIAMNVTDSGSTSAPDSIQWMPPGQHEICPLVNGEASEPFTVNVDAALATLMNEQLQELRAQAQAGNGDIPYIDFNHEDQEAAGEVLGFYWAGNDPKQGGIRARVNWSSAGRAAVEGRTYRRFSPQWEMNPHTKEPVGLSPNVGGLVNRAAFQSIAPVMARSGENRTVTVRGVASETRQLIAQARAAVRADRINPIKSDRLDMVTAMAEAIRSNPGFYERYRKAVVLNGEFGPCALQGGGGGSTGPKVISKEAKAMNADYMAKGRKRAAKQGISLTSALAQIAAEHPDLVENYRRTTMR